jgi:hypothetical protein
MNEADSDAIDELGRPDEIGKVFVGFHGPCIKKLHKRDSFYVVGMIHARHIMRSNFA